MASVSKLDWSRFVGTPCLAAALKPLLKGIDTICKLLQRRLDQITKKNLSRAVSVENSENKRDVGAAFLGSFTAVAVQPGEFWAEVDKAKLKKKAKRRGRKATEFTICVAHAVKKLFDDLRRKDDWEVISLTDKVMCIDKYGDAVGNTMLCPNTRARYRAQFRGELEKGVERCCIQVFGALNGGQNPDCLLVWKVPPVKRANYLGNSQRAICEARKMVPQHLIREAIAHFNRIIGGIACIPAKVSLFEV